MKKELIDLSNRSRRKNIVFHNVPEGAEGENGYLKYVTDFLKNELEIDPPPQIEVAHRYLARSLQMKTVKINTQDSFMLHAYIGLIGIAYWRQL